MRHWLPVLLASQVAGTALADVGFGFGPTHALAGGFCLLAATLWARARPRVSAPCAALAFVFVGGLGFEAHRAPAFSDTALAVGTRRTVDARIATLRPRSDGVSLELGGLRIEPPGAGPAESWPGRLRLFVPADAPAHDFLAMRQLGERLRLRLVLRPLDGPRNPGIGTRHRADRRRGVWARATLAHAEAWTAVALPPRPRESNEVGVRERAVERLQASGRGGGLLAALGLGAQGALDADARRDLRVAGLSHLVAISGLHLGMIATLAFAATGRLLRLARCGAWLDPLPWKCGSAVGVALAYAGMSGLGLPVRRASVALCVAIVLVCIGRRSSWLPAWCIAASCISALDPMAVFALGPQLSFGVTAALASARLGGVVDASPDSRRLERAGRAFLGLVDASAVALASSASILAGHGMTAHASSLVANVIAVPFTGIFLLPAALLASGGAAFAPEHASVEALLAGLSCLAGLVLDAVARWTGAVVGTVDVPLPVSGAALVGGLVFALAAIRAPTTSLRVASALCVVWLVQLPSTAPVSVEGPALVAFDVGQGDALLLHDAETAILIDAGWASPTGDFDAGARVVRPGLRALGVRRLDLVVVTHADLDHRGGMLAALADLPVERLWLPAPAIDAPAFEPLRARVEGAGGRVEARAAGDLPERIGEFRLEVLWPLRERRPSSTNESSLVFRVDVAGTRLLLMGDAGFETEHALIAGGLDLRASVLKLGHHGSRTASSAAFLEAVRPDWVVVSAACNVARALPDPGTLERVGRQAAEVLWTGRDGAVRLRLDAPARPRPFEPKPRRRRCRGDASEASALPLDGPSRRVVRPGNGGAGPGVGARRSPALAWPGDARLSADPGDQRVPEPP